MPPKKRASSMADRMAARNRASVMGSGTGDAQMDSLLTKETNRRTAFAGSVGTTGTAMSNPIRRAYESVMGLFKPRKRK